MPQVTVRPKGAQLNVAFNPALVLKYDLDRFDYVLLDVAENKRSVTFRFGKEKIVGDALAYKLGRDGGTGKKKETRTRVALVSAALFPMLAPKKYEPEGRRRGDAVDVTIKVPSFTRVPDAE